jgi:hypothetical protein
MTALYLNLAIGAKRRLESLKRSAAMQNEGQVKRGLVGAYTWRTMRFATFETQESINQGFNGKDGKPVPVWTTFNGKDTFGRTQYADDVQYDSYSGRAVIEHTGWFADVHCDHTARGFVVSLPHGRYLAGYEYNMNDECVLFGDVHDSAKDAARAADEHARVFAEDEREYSEKYYAARELESENENALQRLRECLALRNNACFTSLREEAHELIETIKGNREKLATDYAGMI